MMGGKILNCIYCKNVSIHTRAEIKVYVCDDCYEKKKKERNELE
jgi:ribosomal protein L37AE/L43A